MCEELKKLDTTVDACKSECISAMNTNMTPPLKSSKSGSVSFINEDKKILIEKKPPLKKFNSFKYFKFVTYDLFVGLNPTNKEFVKDFSMEVSAKKEQEIQEEHSYAEVAPCK